jgi:type IV fimbrial biogenesis protein FimT
MDTAHPPIRRLPRRNAGFSLPELLVVMAVAAVLLALAVPSFGAMADTVRLNALQSDLLAHLQLARSEAIKRAGRVALCKSADRRSCATAGGWEQGWIVFFDANNDGVRDAGETLIQSGDGSARGLLASGNQNVARYVSFDRNGEARTVTGAFQAGTITMCRASAGAAGARQIVINAFGRPRLQKSTVASCA